MKIKDTAWQCSWALQGVLMAVHGACSVLLLGSIIVHLGADIHCPACTLHSAKCSDPMAKHAGAHGLDCRT